jgi:hypothetical protein
MMRIPREARNRDLISRGRGPAGFPDRSRTYRSHAGEALADGANIPGLFLWMAGLLLLGLTLIAAAGGFHGWTIIAGILTVVFLGGSATWIVLEHKRVKAKEGLGLRDPLGH